MAAAGVAMEPWSRAKERDLDLDSDTPQLLSEERIEHIAARRTPQLADHASNRLVVGVGITRDKYFEVCLVFNYNMTYRTKMLAQLFPNNASFSWLDGWIILEELPVSRLHGFAAGEFSRLVHNAIPNLESGNESSYSTPNWTMQPDACLQPDTLPDPGPGHANAATPGGGAWPTLVFEIHFRRSLSDLMDRIGLWLGAGTQVQIVIAIKCYTRVGGNIPMMAVRYERGAVNPVYCVSFGTRALRPASVNAIANHGANLVGIGAGGPACNGLGIATYQMHIPSALIFNGVPLPVGASPFYTIDLFTLQQKIIRKYE